MNALHAHELLLLILAITSQMIHSGELTDLDSLYTHMFTNYSAKTKPVLNHTEKVIIQVICYISNINYFDEMSSELSVTMSVDLSWTEERISWDPANFNGITSIPVCPEDLWRPKLFLLEEADRVKDIGNVSIKPRIWNNGAVYWTTGNVFKATCSVDVLYFPYDQQKCELTLLDWDLYSSDVILIPNSSTVQQPFYKTNSQWELASGTLRECTDLPGACINALFVLKRRSTFFVIYIIVPLIFLAMINSLVFLIPANSGERTSVAVTAFLSFVVYMGIVNDVVPQSSDPLAYVYYYIMTLMIYSCIIMFLCICSLRIYGAQRSVPQWLNTLIWYLRLTFLLLRKSKVADQRSIIQRDRLRLENIMEEGYDAHNTDMVQEINTNNVDTTRDTHNADIDEEMNTNNADTISTGNTFGKRIDYKASWYTVGRTFDCYCCITLCVSLLCFTLQTFIGISQNADLFNVI